MDGHVGERQGAHQELVLLDRVHAAEPRAERVAHGLVARAGAQDVGDPLGDLAVARAQDRVERPGGREQPVHLHAGDDVLEPPEAVLRLEVGREQLEAGRDDDRADLGLELLVAGVEVDAPVDRAGRDALVALGADRAVEAAAGGRAGLRLGQRRLDLAGSRWARRRASSPPGAAPAARRPSGGRGPAPCRRPAAGRRSRRGSRRSASGRSCARRGGPRRRRG